jgi:hypothetical protein
MTNASGRNVVLLDLTAFLLTRQSQAYTCDEGYSYPGPPVNGVTLKTVPKKDQEAIREHDRPQYEKLTAETWTELPLDADKMAQASRPWNEEIDARRAR